MVNAKHNEQQNGDNTLFHWQVNAPTLFNFDLQLSQEQLKLETAVGKWDKRVQLEIPPKVTEYANAAYQTSRPYAISAWNYVAESPVGKYVANAAEQKQKWKSAQTYMFISAGFQNFETIEYILIKAEPKISYVPGC